MKMRTMWMVLLMCGTAMAATQTMQQRLDAKLPSLKIANQPLVDALATLGKKANLRVAVDWASLEATGVKKTDRVSVSLADIKAATALNVILSKVRKRGKPLSWVQAPEGIYVSTQATILSVGKNPPTSPRAGATRTTTTARPSARRKQKSVASISSSPNSRSRKCCSTTRNSPASICTSTGVRCKTKGSRKPLR